MNYTSKQITDFAERTTDYTFGASDLDSIFKEIGVVNYLEGIGLGKKIDEMHLEDENFDYKKAERIMQYFEIEFKI